MGAGGEYGQSRREGRPSRALGGSPQQGTAREDFSGEDQGELSWREH